MLAKVHFVWSPLLRAFCPLECRMELSSRMDVFFPLVIERTMNIMEKNDDVLDSKPINQSKPSFPHHFPCHFPSDFPCFRLTSKLQGPDVLVCCSRAGNVYAEEWGAPLCAVPVTVARRWDRRKTDMTIRHVKLILFRTFNGNSSSTFDDINDTFTIIYHIVIQILFMFTFLFNHI